MKKLIKMISMLVLGATLVAAAGFGTASSEKIKMLTGPDGKQYQYIIGTALKEGKYYNAGKKLAHVLNDAGAFESDGSWQNLELLNKGFINVAFVQSDVYNLWISKNKEAKQYLAVIPTNYKEYVHLIMRKGGDEDDLQEEGATVLIGLANSGGAGSWRNMVRLEDGYAKATPVVGPIDAIALNDLVEHKIDGIIRTSHITLDDDILQRVNKNDAIEFVDLDDSDLNDDIEINGKDEPVYNFVKVRTKDSMFGNKNKMLETKVFVIINTKLTTRDQRGQIIDKVTLFGNGLFE